jgi:15-cis-phytoene synthase
MSTAVQPASSFAPTDSQLAVAYSVCKGIARTNAKNFYYGFLVLPKRKREAISAVYAFMRRCDDITDDPSLPLAERREKLAIWIDSFHRAAAGLGTDDAVLLALADTQRRYSIPVELLDHLAHGTGMDLQEQMETGKTPSFDPNAINVHYRKFDDLYLYCYRVASVVGLVCIRIFGYQDARAEALAERLGIAFQLTNIIRDVQEDAAMGRVYLPGEDLAKFGLLAIDLRSGGDTTRFRPLLEMEAERARKFYLAAEDLMPLIDEDSQPALWTLVAVYRALLEKIAAANYNVFGPKIRLTTFEKLSILGKGFLRRLT